MRCRKVCAVYIVLYCIVVVHCTRLDTSCANVNSTDTEFGVTVNITCLPGYIIDGQATAVVHCDSTGQWSVNASCLRK